MGKIKLSDMKNPFQYVQFYLFILLFTIHTQQKASTQKKEYINTTTSQL